MHCAAGAVWMGVAGLGRAIDERLELPFALVAMSIATLALGRGYRAHRARLPAILGVLGVSLLVSSRLVELEAGWFEQGLSISGAVALVSAHVVNLRAHRQCCVPRADRANESL